MGEGKAGGAAVLQVSIKYSEAFLGAAQNSDEISGFGYFDEMDLKFLSRSSRMPNVKINQPVSHLGDIRETG
ncbi:hypothetical protein [Actibacterium pelagium]|uniref:Uncharacterized protein n=1 Tax=Actibacterium pelagium TaxID=2029103 RepID=A0A917ANN0_9RHOB|nr:hypothetical protein [Actibacterium pelagium]GGE62835.1 hypothetical protein GCM10011517_33210 [Actibacterium pelagium]